MGFIITTDELPRTRLGKLQRFLIKDRYIHELLGAKATPQINKEIAEKIAEENANDANLLTNPMSQKIITLLQETTKNDKKINLSDHLEIDLGIDSLNRVELAVSLEKLSNKKMSEATFSKIATVKDLILEFVSSQEKVQLTSGVAIAQPSWQSILNEELPENLRNQIELKNTGLGKTSLKIATSAFVQCFNLFWRTKTIGAENLPKNQPFILCSNHCSYLDGLIIYVGMPKWLKAQLFFLGQKTFFDVPIIKSLIKFMHVIPIDPALQLINAMQACAYVLRNGKPLCIFPEGSRSIDGEVKEFKKGVGILAKELNIPLVPVYIDGSFAAWPRPKPLPKPHKIQIICGKPYTIDELLPIGKNLGAKDDYEAIAKGIREKVIALTELTRHPYKKPKCA
jgi:long-chain acyl-CoA synthetase